MGRKKDQQTAPPAAESAMPLKVTPLSGQGAAAGAVERPLPSVSICTVTRNRQAFLPLLQTCVASQTYPHHLMEWVIVDDSDNGEAPFQPDPDLDVRVNHVVLESPLILGQKRNVSHEHCGGEIIVYMDDDDYYPPQRVSHAVDRLRETGRLVAGGTLMPIYFTDTGQAWITGPYRANHATANTFAFRRELLKQTRYEAAATHAEEKAFLKNYEIPMAQLDPARTILCMGHSSNTFDKRKLIQGGNNPKMRKLADMPPEFIQPDSLKAYARLHRASARPAVQQASPAAVEPRQQDRPVVGAWYINLDQHRDRRIFVESQQDMLPDAVMLERISALTPEKLANVPEYAYLQLLDPLRQIQHCIVLSHLTALEDFARNSQATHALILEDDIDLSCMRYWGFDIIDVAQRMQTGHGILQLNVIWSAAAQGDKARFLVPQIMHHHPRSSREYSTAAYLIHRDTAAAILDFFKPCGRDFFNLLRYENKDMIVADGLLFDAEGIGHGQPSFCLPIFCLGDERLGLVMPPCIARRVNTWSTT
jgi:hypothetical protein